MPRSWVTRRDTEYKRDSGVPGSFWSCGMVQRRSGNQSSILFVVIEVSLLMLSLKFRRSHFSKMGIIKVMRLF